MWKSFKQYVEARDDFTGRGVPWYTTNPEAQKAPPTQPPESLAVVHQMGQEMKRQRQKEQEVWEKAHAMEGKTFIVTDKMDGGPQWKNDLAMRFGVGATVVVQKVHSQNVTLKVNGKTKQTTPGGLVARVYFGFLREAPPEAEAPQTLRPTG